MCCNKFVRAGFLTLLLTGFLLPLMAGEWQFAPPMNTPRVGAVAVSYQGELYVFGGKSTGNIILNTVEKFNPVTQSWDNTTVPNFNYPRMNAAAIVFQGKIYLAGGANQSGTLKKVEVYDPVQNSWSEVQEMRREREGHSLIFFRNRIFALAGIRDQYYYLEEMEWYNLPENQWMQADSELVRPRAAAFITATSDSVYLFGGEHYGATSTTFVADTNWAWHQGPSMGTGRHYGGTVRIGNRIFLIGGETSSGVTNQVEYYDIDTGSFGTAPNLQLARSGLAAAAIGDTIFAIGGWSVYHYQILSSVEYWIPEPVGIDHNPSPTLPATFATINAFPNPFNGQVNFKMNVRQPGAYQLTLFNVRGQKVATLFKGTLPPGERLVHWSPETGTNSAISSGIYLAVLFKDKKPVQNLKIAYVK